VYVMASIDHIPALAEAALRVGGVAKLAEMLGVSRQAVYKWTRVPAERAPQIERLTGVSRAELRPDLYEVEK